MPKVSVIIVTRNRVDSLAPTLESILRIAPPSELATELLVVDNGSTDGTAQLVKSVAGGHIPVRYLFEPRRGKSNGLNLAMTEAAGEIFLFTDDDVRVPDDWVEGMCGPILDGRADAVAGGIRMAAHLRRPWMGPSDCLALACNEGIDEGGDNPHLVGANMAIARRVFQIVPAFDPELGPGICDGGEDTLLSLQLRAAGLRIVRGSDAGIEHHFDPARLSRSSIRRSTVGGAFCDFYIAHHWSHTAVAHPLYRAFRAFCKLQYKRIGHFPQWWRHEAMPDWERRLIQEINASLLHRKLGRLLRNYRKFGLVKLNGERAASHLPQRDVQAVH